MATNNFYNENARAIYAVSDEEYEFFDYEAIIKKLEKELNKREYSVVNEDYSDVTSLRSYPATVFGSLSFDKMIEVKNFECSIDVTIELVIRDGYYEGANLDYNILCYYNGENIGDYNELEEFVMNEFDFIKDDFDDDEDEYQAREDLDNQLYEVYNLLEEARDKIEEVYKEFTECYNKIGQFSDGSALYEPCND